MKSQAIVLCRVSSLEQLKNNSLNYQHDIVFNEAKKLDVDIPSDGVWQGQVSSKKGVNYNRKDLLQMVEYCKKHSRVKFLIVSEVDRFMRSPDEQTFWYVRFKYELGVKVWFVGRDDLNADTHEASLLRYLDGWRAGGSNEERINKSINGQTAALQDGRYPFHPKPGYIKGSRNGIHDIDPVRGPILKTALERIADHLVTPSQALIELNNSDFVKGRALYKMDKFRGIITDPYYAGIVEINKQVKVRNENGLHDPLITKSRHLELLKIMDAKKKNQSGPRKNGNPKYPCNNIVSHSRCKGEKNGRVVGFDNDNGKNKTKIYEKYRCRACGEYWHRKDMHQGIKDRFRDHPLTEKGVETLIEALDDVWIQKEGEDVQEAARIARKIESLNESVQSQALAAIDPSNALIKEEIMTSITKAKAQVEDLEETLLKLEQKTEDDRKRFMKFAFDFIENMGDHFLDPGMLQDNRLRCKQIIFPGGFWIDDNKKVYTPEISPLIRLASNKKDLPETEKSSMVRVQRL